MLTWDMELPPGTRSGCAHDHRDVRGRSPYAAAGNSCQTAQESPWRRGSPSSARVKPRELRQVILDLVVVALVGHEDVLREFCAGRRIQRAHGNGHLAVVIRERLPEERGPALGTEPAP